ncbi:MAG: hypothetical protein FJW66_05895, partial [Actinobacteria bacterium]|nr:hypothetical protein [Actinomycetota bacterium]
EGSILTMDKVLQIQKFVSTSAYTEGKKICIIREADLMNREAANRILKVLEEPPDDSSIFMLLTEDLSGIIPTISSRCIIFEWDFTVNENLKLNFNYKNLEDMLDAGIKNIVKSRDSYSPALDLSIQICDFFKQQLPDKSAEIKNRIMELKNIGATTSEVKKFEESLNLKSRRKFSKYYNIGINMIFDIITAWLEDILSVNLGAGDAVLNYPQKYSYISENFANADNEKILKLINTVDKNRNYLKYSTSRELALDNIFLQMQALTNR